MEFEAFLLVVLCGCGLLSTASAYTESTCEGGTIRAWCSTSSNEWLRIDDAFWGRVSTTTCPGSNAGATTCVNTNMLDEVRRVCEGRKDCKISAQWRSLGDPCPGTSKYANVTYSCIADCSNRISDTECATRKAAGECETNRTVMIDSCFRECTRCNEFNPNNCDNAHGGDSFSNTNVDCDYWAFGGDCYQDPAYMLHNCEESCKACAAESQHTVQGCEGTDINMTCDPPYFIDVNEVKYGRFDTSFCPHETATSDNLCEPSSVALERVRRACEGRPHCYAKVVNIALDPSDPCPNISKQAEVTYTCKLCKNAMSNSECEQRALNQECTFNRVEMMLNCYAECSGCKNAVCGNDEADTKDCDYWAMQGECPINTDFMPYRCAQSCLTCDCKNNAADGACRNWASDGECAANPGWMLYNCAKACGTCYQCVNALGNDGTCNFFASIGECSVNPFWMLYRCAHACYACGDKVGPFAHKVCEGSTTRLHCDNSGQKIRITEVFFGRRNNDTCPHPSFTAGLNCAASNNSIANVTHVCNGRSDCYIQPITGLFGDPCEGVTKQLEVEYFCQDCFNKLGDSECATRRGNGECESDKAVMLDGCFKECTQCANAECANAVSTADCDYWAMIGECEKEPTWMNSNCKRSCGGCITL